MENCTEWINVDTLLPRWNQLIWVNINGQYTLENVIYFDFFIYTLQIHYHDYIETTGGNGSPTAGHGQYLRHNHDHDFDHGNNNANYWLCPNKTETNGKMPTHQAHPYNESLRKHNGGFLDF